MAVEESYAALARELVLEFFVVQERVVGESAGVFFLSEDADNLEICLEEAGISGYRFVFTALTCVVKEG